MVFAYQANTVIISYFIQRILWVDCIGAFLTGLLLLLFNGWLSSLYGLSPNLVIAHAFVHLIYGAYSFSLAVRKQRPMTMLLVLIFANGGWACLCFVFAAALIGNATALAIAAFVVEGLYVGGLGLVEWHRRELLQEQP